MWSRAGVVLVLVLFFTYGRPARAQARLGAVFGVVTDSGGRTLPGVEITALKTSATTRSDSAGRFILVALPPGPTDLVVRRVGYSPLTLIVEIPPADTTDVEIRLGVAAQPLDAVVVQEDRDRVRRLVAFETRRQQSGAGHFITRDEIEKRHPMVLSDMIRSVPGVIIGGRDVGRSTVRFARSGRETCPPQFFVDGIQVDNFSIDDMPPGDVEGIELYSGVAGVPPEYNRVHGTTVCGTILIWSRVPGVPAEPPKKP